MNVIDLLERQHREVEQLFERFRDTEDQKERRQIADRIVQDLMMHAELEEELFYPAVRQDLPQLEDDVLEDLEEHHVVEFLVDEIAEMDAADERFVAKVSVLEELVSHHVEEEESELFPQVRAELGEDRLTELGARMEERSSEAEADDATKDELYEQAKELDVEGRSSMSKDELAEAVERES